MLNSLNASVAPPVLVGHFVGLKLPYLVDNSIAKRFWGGSYRPSEVLLLENGIFLFTFDSVDQVTNVLDIALWQMANALKHWQPNMKFSKDDLTRVLV